MSPNWGDARKEQGFGLLAQFVRVYVCSTTSHAARLRRRSIPNLQKADSVKEHRDENVAIGEDDDDDNCRRQRRRTNSKLCGWVSIVIGGGRLGGGSRSVENASFFSAGLVRALPNLATQSSAVRVLSGCR